MGSEDWKLDKILKKEVYQNTNEIKKKSKVCENKPPINTLADLLTPDDPSDLYLAERNQKLAIGNKL